MKTTTVGSMVGIGGSAKPQALAVAAVTTGAAVTALTEASEAEARVRLYLAAAGVAQEPVATHTVRRLLEEVRRVRGELAEPALTEAVMKLVIDHHHGLPVVRPAKPATARRAMKPQRMRSVFVLLGLRAERELRKLRQRCERAQARHLRPTREAT